MSVEKVLGQIEGSIYKEDFIQLTKELKDLIAHKERVAVEEFIGYQAQFSHWSQDVIDVNNALADSYLKERE